jgi:tripeptide aminopeptidase
LEPEPTIAAGGSDANSLNARGLPAVNLGVGAQNPHSTKEFVLLEDLAMDLEMAKHLVSKELLD